MTYQNGSVESLIFNAAISKLNPFSSAEQKQLLAHLMVAQSKHETANYKSSAFKNLNNAFGYKQYKGSSYQIGSGGTPTDGGKFAKYANVENSALEVASWINRRWNDFKNVQTPTDYANALKKNLYYTNPTAEYIRGLTFYMGSKTFTTSPQKNSNINSLLFMIIGLTTIYIFYKN